MEEPWTILELAELAADALAATAPAESAGGAGLAGEAESGGAQAVRARANGRVRDVPNERLVRWYVTVGLVDPPLSRRGRVARYGRRHLLQLVAVKRRQAEGRSLAEIQAELAGATDEALAAVARVPDTQPGPDVLWTAPARFWARSAGRPEPGDAERPGEQGPTAAERSGEREPGAAERSRRAVAAAARGNRTDQDGNGLVHGIRLAPGVVLLLEDGGREPGPDDVTEIVNAARPLLEELASRGLRAAGPGHPADVPGPPPEVGQLAEGSRT
ncbi:MAG: MerR family transcriptional regulator [Streptosporangiaceae bacterium]